jgi:hypothetical protein
MGQEQFPDIGFLDSPKSYLQTLEEFSKQLQDYDQAMNFYEKQSQLINDFYKLKELNSEKPVEVDYSQYQSMLIKVVM